MIETPDSYDCGREYGGVAAALNLGISKGLEDRGTRGTSENASFAGTQAFATASIEDWYRVWVSSCRMPGVR